MAEANPLAEPWNVAYAVGVGFKQSFKVWFGGVGSAVSAHFYKRRQQVMNLILSMLYGNPVQVTPKGYVGLAGAVVMWFVENGQRFFLMVRQEPSVLGGDGKARFISCLGVGAEGDMGAALRMVAKVQMGDIFVKSAFARGALQADRIACAPLFSTTDDTVGTPVPVQSLVWVVQVNPNVLDIINTPHGVQALRVPEQAMDSDKVSATHRALWEVSRRHLPKMRAMPATTRAADLADEVIRDLASGGRVLN